MNKDIDRYLGCLIGLACGDAVGTTVEFSSRGSFPELKDMIGGGVFELKAGQWTDDTSMALCLAHSLIEKGRFDAEDQMDRYVKWYRYGYMSSTGECFDIGTTVSSALQRYIVSGNPFSGSEEPYTAGNGGIMRLAPVAMFYAQSLENTVKFCTQSSRTTHGAEEAVQSACVFGVQIRAALLGQSKEQILRPQGFNPSSPKVQAIVKAEYIGKPINDIRGSGYVIESLEAALWCFANTENYKSAVLMAANLGEDADTTAAIVGQLAGAYYGLSSIPSEWLSKLFMMREIVELAELIYAASKKV